MDQNIFFTSDTHLGHDNILIHDKRPFVTIEEHDAALISNWNSVVGPRDVVYHLGDFALSTPEHTRWLRSQLHGQINLIAGNHDDDNRTLSKCWGWVKDLYDLRVSDPDAPLGRQKLVLCHYPLASWRGRGKGNWMIHGHCHGKLTDEPDALRIDVGANIQNYTPLSYAQIKAFMQERKAQIEARGVEMTTLV